jgi:hypothetical protein
MKKLSTIFPKTGRIARAFFTNPYPIKKHEK